MHLNVNRIIFFICFAKDLNKQILAMQNSTQLTESLSNELGTILENYNLGLITYREYIGQSFAAIDKAKVSLSNFIIDNDLFN